jgi:hypothetical protein
VRCGLIGNETGSQKRQTKKSYIKWLATVEVDNGFGAPGATFHRQTSPLTGKVKEGVQPHSKAALSNSTLMLITDYLS